jgi:hypothetical protein
MTHLALLSGRKSRAYKTKMRSLPDGEWRDVTVTEYASFADMPGWKDRPTATVVYLKECTPAELKRLKHMTSAQIRALAKRHAKRRRKAVAP